MFHSREQHTQLDVCWQFRALTLRTVGRKRRSTGINVSALAAFLLVLISRASKANGLAHGRPIPEGMIQDAPLATAYCTRPEFAGTNCGWATDEEQAATISHQCPFCEMWGMWPDRAPTRLPRNITASYRGSLMTFQYISLACKGPLIVRTVFKFWKQPAWITDSEFYQDDMVKVEGADCTPSSLGIKPQFSSVHSDTPIRCRLELPAGPGSEVERALRSKEVECWECGACGNGQGCPSETGVWYSDSVVLRRDGCIDYCNDKYCYYTAPVVGVVTYPGTKLLLAKFEACNNPGCFDAKYEAAKFAAVKRCDRGKCP